MHKKPQSSNENRATDKPFFARFLEDQDLAEANAGATTKHPSDSDEDFPDWPKQWQ